MKLVLRPEVILKRSNKRETNIEARFHIFILITLENLHFSFENMGQEDPILFEKFMIASSF